MSAISKLAKATVSVGAVTLGFSSILYECALNTNVIPKFMGLFSSKREKYTNGSDSEKAAWAKAQRVWFDEHKGEDKVIYTEKSGNTHAYIILNEVPSNKWVVLNHGYTADPEGTASYAKMFYEMGYNTVSPAMRGWGNDEYSYCSMGHYDKFICLAWVKYIASAYPDSQIAILGYSMGGATTMLTLGEADLPENVKCAVSDCGFTTVYEQYAHVLKHDASMPAFPLLDMANMISKLRGNFDFKKTAPIETIKKATVPVLFIHGSDDSFVPVEMVDVLYDACPTEKDKLVVEGAVHANSIDTAPELYRAKVKEFTDKYIK